MKSSLLYWVALLATPVMLLAEERICVLSYEKRTHPFTQMIRDVFADNPHVILKIEAIPLDFLDCVREGVSEIIVAAHSFQIDRSGEKFRLGYFAEIFGERRAEVVEKFRMEVDSGLDAVNRELARYHCPAAPMGRSRVRLRKCRRLANERRTWEQMASTLDELSEDQPLYDARLFYNRVFSRSLDFLREQREQGLEIALKNIRLMGCTPEEVLSGHPPLGELLHEFNIGIDFAPRQNILSWLKRKYVATMDQRWLGTSAQFDDAESADDGFYVYLNLKTLFFYRRGQASALRGKYKVTVRGLAIGLASKWSTVFIRYSEVAGMEIGEKRKINMPQLDLQFALWWNAEVQLGRASGVLGPSEINSLGVSIGFFESVEVERVH